MAVGGLGIGRFELMFRGKGLETVVFEPQIRYSQFGRKYRGKVGVFYPQDSLANVP